MNRALEFCQAFNQEACDRLAFLLEHRILWATGLKIKLKVWAITSGNRPYIRVLSENFANDMHPKMFKEICIGEFNSSVIDNSDTLSKGKFPGWWLSICFAYSDFNCGRNCTQILEVDIDKDGHILDTYYRNPNVKEQ